MKLAFASSVRALSRVVPVPVSVPLSVPVRFGSKNDGSLVLSSS